MKFVSGALSLRKFWCGAALYVLFASIPHSVPGYPSVADSNERQALLVDIGWVTAHLDDPDIVIIDTRIPKEYEQGHIAGAINLPLADTYQPRLMRRVISQIEFQDVLGSRGIQNDDHIVLYGKGSFKDATRILWMLELYGHAHTSLVNGGYAALEDAGLPVDTRVPVLAPANYRAVISPGRLATKLQMLLAIDNPDIRVVDVRDTIDYQGFASRASRSGHIPMAINIPRSQNLKVRQGGFYIKPRPALEQLYQELDDAKRVIIYCDGGRESSITYLALRLLGKEVSIYEGGWEEWGNNRELPIVTLEQ